MRGTEARILAGATAAGIGILCIAYGWHLLNSCTAGFYVRLGAYDCVAHGYAAQGTSFVIFGVISVVSGVLVAVVAALQGPKR